MCYEHYDGSHPRINLQTKSRFSSLLRVKTQGHELFYLLGKKKKKHLITSENGKGKLIKYYNLKMADYLPSIDTDMSIDVKKLNFYAELKILTYSQTGNRTMKIPIAKIVQMKYLHIYSIENI